MILRFYFMAGWQINILQIFSHEPPAHHLCWSFAEPADGEVVVVVLVLGEPVPLSLQKLSSLVTGRRFL